MTFLYVATFLALLSLMLQLVIKVWLIDAEIAKITASILFAIFVLLVKG